MIIYTRVCTAYALEVAANQFVLQELHSYSFLRRLQELHFNSFWRRLWRNDIHTSLHSMGLGCAPNQCILQEMHFYSFWRRLRKHYIHTSLHSMGSGFSANQFILQELHFNSFLRKQVLHTPLLVSACVNKRHSIHLAQIMEK